MALTRTPRAPHSADSARVIGRDIPLGQVFRNLIDNARSFSPPDGEVRVSLDASGLAPGSHVLEVQVIPPEGIRVQGINPQVVEVVISALASETPGVPVTPTP